MRRGCPSLGVAAVRRATAPSVPSPAVRLLAHAEPCMCFPRFPLARWSCDGTRCRARQTEITGVWRARPNNRPGRARDRFMYRHHRESAERTAAHFAGDASVLALILGGSVAHGFAAADSDLDVLIVVSDAEYAQRRREGRLQFLDSDLCTYPNGYVDGKYLAESLLR